MTDPTDDKVVEVEAWKALGDGEEEPYLVLHHGTDSPFCGHRCQVKLDYDKRKIFCSRCRTELDPYEVLNRLANEEGLLRYSVGKKRAIQSQIRELKAEEKRVKARLGRAQKKLGLEGGNP